MAKTQEPVTIKKYANRRLYNTGTSTYVTLEDLATMVKEGEDFVVYDAKNGDDITHSVLTQIIFEQENKGQNLLPIAFLRQIIRFYGDSMQMMVPRYLEMSIDSFTKEQGKFRDQYAKTLINSPLTGSPLPGTPFGGFDEHVRRNMEMFERAFNIFLPFPKGEAGEPPAPAPAPATPEHSADELEVLKRQMLDMQQKLEKLVSKPDTSSSS
ncbi:polyhydroxyalkanoate synthesis repressor PhaR [Xanthobacter sp. DSM 24535]|uniref:polyhydroxyalkanoate synthesis repressor PhaR n=1 Tax=Roseixanthobacter psychrophilus TaxID=3119917 RepID=UPI00372B67D8